MTRPRGRERRLLKDALHEAKSLHDAASRDERFWAREAFIEENVNGRPLGPWRSSLLARATSEIDRLTQVIEDLKARLRG